MPKKPLTDLSKLQVIVPYQDFLTLLAAAQSVEELTDSFSRLKDQQGALRSQFTEVMEAFQELKDFVLD